MLFRLLHVAKFLALARLSYCPIHALPLNVLLLEVPYSVYRCMKISHIVILNTIVWPND